MYYIVLQYAAIACKSEMIPLEHGTTPSGQDPTGNCPHRSWPPEQRFAVNCERFGMLYVTPEMWKKTHSTDQQTMVNYCEFGFDHGISWQLMAYHGTSNLRSACLCSAYGQWIPTWKQTPAMTLSGFLALRNKSWLSGLSGLTAPEGHPGNIRKPSGNLSKSQK